MRKKWTVFFLTCICLLWVSPANAQQRENIFQKPTTTKSDSSTFNLYPLSPTNNSSKAYDDLKAPVNPFPSYKPIKGITKTLLIWTTDLIRDDKNSIYSFQNAWMYPGPTVKYPQSSTEMKLFLKRYNRYAIGSH